MIRRITESDSVQFLQLLKNADASGFMLFEPGERKSSEEEERKKIQRFLEDEQSIIFVFEDSDQLAGYIIGMGSSLKRKKHSAYVVVGVHSDFRGKGIGKKLFEQLFVWAKNQHLSRLELTVIKSNTRAVKLYHSLGFKIEGEKIGSLMIDGVPVDEYYMYKWID